ncbi:MAG: NrdH-redoxin [Chloroflexi bacterium]|nr:NrdH-redoxin [Chloroflexota bacterium]
MDHITMYGTTWCPDCTRSKRLLDRHQVPYTWVNIDEDPTAAALVMRLNQGRRIVPTIVFPDGSVLAEPSDPELARKLGLA